MADEWVLPQPTDLPDPGWSNNPPGAGTGVEVAPQELNISTPGWSNNPAGAGNPVDSSGILAPPGWSNTGAAATGATAGAPGSFTPAGSVPPYTLSGMTGITATPATAWTTGQYVALRDGNPVSWNGTAWAAGKRP